MLISDSYNVELAEKCTLYVKKKSADFFQLTFNL